MIIPPARIHVRFSDLDVLGHVNNAVYLSYFEIARVHYFKYLVGSDWNWKTGGVILARNEIEYYKPVLLTDEPYIEMHASRIGTKSFTLDYKLTVKGELYTTGSSVLVCFNSAENKTIDIPVDLRKALSHILRNDL